jgi:hypothetical protein
LPDEIDLVSSQGSQAIPTISFGDIARLELAEVFLQGVRRKGVGIIRNVVSRDNALSWGRGAEEYMKQTREAPTPYTPKSQGVYWSTAQVQARAHPNVLAAQRFVMSIWKSKDANARVTTGFPITYADRTRARVRGGTSGATHAHDTYDAHVDGGSVERWEPDGYGRAGTYKAIFQGRWEDYDPWEVCNLPQ